MRRYFLSSHILYYTSTTPEEGAGRPLTAAICNGVCHFDFAPSAWYPRARMFAPAAHPPRWSSQILYLPSDQTTGRTLLLRAAILILLFCAVLALLWVDRDGLRDQADGEISFVDVVYFSVITITTVGYGDIVPVTSRARLIDALVITPIRIFVWLLFLGTAYQLIIRQYVEGYRMAMLQTRLDRHIIVCGYGHTGSAAVKELLAKGVAASQIVVIEEHEERVRLATSAGLTALCGDAAQEAMLTRVALDKAKAVIVAAGRDDTNVLIVLTARHMNPTVRILASAKQEENVKLLRQGGANAVISPATVGGYALAAAVDQEHLTEYLLDLLTAGGRINLIERPIEPGEVGKRASDLAPDLVVRVYREGRIVSLAELQGGLTLKAGDRLILLKSVQDPATTT